LESLLQPPILTFKREHS
jgi:hypothetical protein